MGRIFFNYRREDSQWAMGRLYDSLVRELGPEEVFMDFSGIPVATDFRDYLATELNRCDVLLAGICTRWVDLFRQRTGTEDHVLMEIETALEIGVPVLPLLLGTEKDLSMPREDELPPSIARISRLDAARVEPGESFYSDVQNLIASIAQLRQTRTHPRDRTHPSGIIFKGIPATNAFARGARPGDREAQENEAMQPPVALRAFWLSETSVTVKQYRAVMGDAAWNALRVRYPQESEYSHQQGDQKPVTRLTCEEAVAFCDRLNQIAESGRDPLPPGYRYRLPTETEWEYACRATVPDQSRYGDFPQIGWVKTGDQQAPFSDVRRRAANPWGLFDMLGLVFEWCSDDEAGRKIVRGGSFNESAEYARASARVAVKPGEISSKIGLRVALGVDTTN